MLGLIGGSMLGVGIAWGRSALTFGGLLIVAIGFLAGMLSTYRDKR